MQVAPLQLDVQVHVFGAEQVPPFWHADEQTATINRCVAHLSSARPNQKIISDVLIDQEVSMYVRVWQTEPDHCDVHVQMLWPEQVPPFWQIGEQTAKQRQPITFG